jgi:hypothetical protein
VDKCGTADDTYTVPSMGGFIYLVGDVATAAGTYPATGTVTITVRPEPTFGIAHPADTKPWTFVFTNVPCDLPHEAVNAFSAKAETCNSATSAEPTGSLSVGFTNTDDATDLSVTPTVKVVSVLGDVVYDKFLGAVADGAGEHALVENLRDGVYTVVFLVGDNVVQEIVVSVTVCAAPAVHLVSVTSPECGVVAVENTNTVPVNLLGGLQYSAGPDVTLVIAPGETKIIKTSRSDFYYEVYTSDWKYVDAASIKVQQGCDVPPVVPPVVDPPAVQPVVNPIVVPPTFVPAAVTLPPVTSLAETGSESGGLIGWALALTAIGTALTVFVARRRRLQS